MADEDFNSSDLEFEAPANPYSRAGANSIDAIVASAAGDRISSKKTSKTLTTADYVGRRTDDSWTKTVDASYEDAFGAEVTENAYKKPSWTRNKLNRMYEETGVEPSTRKGTREVRERKYKEHAAQWRDDQKAQLSRPALLPLRTNQNANSSKGKRPRESDVVGASSTSRKHVRIDAADSSVSALELGADDDNIQSRIDAGLLNNSKSTSEIVADAEGSAVLSDEVENIVINELGTPFNLPPALKLPDMEYLSLLSRINLLANKKLASSKLKGIPDTFRGNGRDETALFQYKCRKTPGCNDFSDNRHHMLTHEARCSKELVDDSKTADRPYMCPEDRCGASFKTKEDLKYHTHNSHKYKPRSCKAEYCDPAVLSV